MQTELISDRRVEYFGATKDTLNNNVIHKLFVIGLAKCCIVQCFLSFTLANCILVDLVIRSDNFSCEITGKCDSDDLITDSITQQIRTGVFTISKQFLGSKSVLRKVSGRDQYPTLNQKTINAHTEPSL